MEKFKKLLPIITMTFLILHCCNFEHKKIVESSSFPLVKSLVGKNIGPRNYFMRATKCMLDSNVLLVLDERNEIFFHFFNINSFKCLGTIGMRGRGPNEIISTPFLSNQPFVHNKILFFYEPSINKIIGYKLKIDVNDTITLENVVKFNMPYEILNPQNIQYLADKSFVARGCLDKGKLVFFNIGDNHLKIIPFVPDVSNASKFRNFYIKYYGDFSFQRERGLLACSNRFFNQVEVYTSDGILLKEIRFSKLQNPFEKKDYNFFYNAIATSPKFIYASFLGIKKSNLKLSNKNKIKTHIHLFKWDGSFVSLYNLDRLTGYFSVDMKNKFMIAIDETNEEQPLVFYDFN